MPSELQIFEKHPDMDAYKVGASFTPYAIMARDKRFTDAELAAEVWHADTSCVLYWHTDREKHTEAWFRMKTLARFATLPHYDEV